MYDDTRGLTVCIPILSSLGWQLEGSSSWSTQAFHVCQLPPRAPQEVIHLLFTHPFIPSFHSSRWLLSVYLL